MASDPALPPVSDSASGQSPLSQHQHQHQHQHTESELEPTSDKNDDGDPDPDPDPDRNGHDDDDSDDDPFNFDVDDSVDITDTVGSREADKPEADVPDASDAYVPRNPHAEALLRRSPSPHSHTQSLSSLPLRTTAVRSSAYAQNRLSAGYSPIYLSPNNFLRPPLGSFAGSMEDLAGSAGSAASVSSAPIDMDEQASHPPSDDSSPFNFQTQFISTSPVKSNNIGQRRGHRYKHSSISAQHQVFQEPPSRPPPVLPASLPIPTVIEAWGSMHRGQRARFYWCLCHAAVATLVFWSASDDGDSLALTALSHLVFFDVMSAAVCVAVDVLGNFEVWRRSTIRHPFGLRRAEVLAGFAMSIFLVFGGFDLLSHELKDILEAAAEGGLNTQGTGHTHTHGVEGAHAATTLATPHLDIGSHGGHHHARFITPGTVDIPAFAAFLSTLVSAYGLGNHVRIRRSLLLLHGVAPFSQSNDGKSGGGGGSGGGFSTVAMFMGAMTWMANVLSGIGLSSVLANPFHFLTVVVSLVLLVLPLMFVAVQAWLDRLLCATIALSMLLLGARLAVAQGLMLLMSYNGKDGGQTTTGAAAVPESKKTSTVSSVLDEIASEPQVARVEDAQFWQVHYGLCMANLNVRVAQGYDDDSSLKSLRMRIARVVQNRLGEGYGRGNSLRWEVTVQTTLEG